MSAPTLWWIPISHFNEKARWYLDHRRLPHRRRKVAPGPHMLVALALTRGRSITFPILQMDGRIYPESTDLILGLEERYGPSGLIPEDDDEVLELVRFFDAVGGPAAIRVVHSDNLGDGTAMGAQLAAAAPGVPDVAITRAAVRVYLKARMRTAPDAAERYWSDVTSTLDRIDEALAKPNGGGRYLVGDRFTLADLTGAALLYPLVLPPKGPQGLPHSRAFEERRETVADRPALAWVSEIYARHR